MKVYGPCSNCKEEMSYSTEAHTRVEFAMNEGETKKLQCKNCGAATDLHVDQLYMKESKLAILLSGIILIAGTPLGIFLINPLVSNNENNYSVYIVGGFLLIPIIAFGILRKQDQVRVSSFNRKKLKGRIHNI